jgi:hypothetical protein
MKRGRSTTQEEKQRAICIEKFLALPASQQTPTKRCGCSRSNNNFTTKIGKPIPQDATSLRRIQTMIQTVF